MKSRISTPVGFVLGLTLTIFCCLPASSQTNVPGTAVSLNGTTNAWLNVPNGTWFSGNFTVEGWVNVRSYNSWSRLIDFSDGPNTNNVYVALSDGATGDPAMGVFTNNDSSPFFSAGTQLPINQWVHLAATGNGTNGTIYLNGTPVGTGMLNIAPNVVRTNNYIGRSAYSADSYANAIFDELSIWNVARTRVQIQTGMNHPLVGNEPGLAGYWRFDEGSGTNTSDSTGNGDTATLNSGVTWTNSSAPLTNAADYALGFSGAQVVTIPHQAAQDAYPLTVMCWFMEPTNSPGNGALVGNYVSSSLNGWQLASSGGQLYAWYYRDSGGDHVGNTGAGAVNDGRWHHAAFVVSSSGGVIYLDGVPKQTNAWAGTAGPCTTTEAAFLGIYQGDSLFTGDIDEVSIWNAALTQSQIQTYMRQPLQGTETGLVNYYRMNEGIGTNIYDYTTNADTGVFSTPLPAWIISGAQIQEPPQVATLPATTNGASATLSGTINPQGLNSGSWFRWGLTTSYGNVTATNTFAASYAISTNSTTLSGLSAGVYHFQIVATNSAGTNYGGDQSFTITVQPQVQLGNTNIVEGPVIGTDSVMLVLSPGSASWNATANASWLHLAASSGAGSTNVIFSCDTNSGTTRTGTLTIAGQTLTITQAGSTYVQVGALTTIVPYASLANGPIAADSAGDVYARNHATVISEWSPANNTLSTVFPNTSGNVHNINGIGVDSAGNLFITDGVFGRFDKWTATNGAITTLASGLSDPYAVAVDGSGNAYFSDIATSRIDEWNATNNSVSVLVSGLQSFGLAADAADNLYFFKQFGANYVVQERSAQNGNINTLVVFDTSATPLSMAVDGGGDLYILNAYADGTWGVVKLLAANGSQTTWVPSTALYGPVAVTVDGARNLYVDNGTNGAAFQELPDAFVVPTAKSYPTNAGSDSLPAVVPANFNLTGPFAPTSDQPWLTITGITNGVVSYSFAANNGIPRTAQIQLLGEPIAVNQAGVPIMPPQVATLPATLNGTSATLNGTVNPEGLNTGCWFNWGLSTSYGNVTAANILPASFTVSTNTNTFNNLPAGTYHFQIVATNALGTSYGVDQSFTITIQFQLGNTNVLEGPASGMDSVVLAASPWNAGWTGTANAPWLHLLTSSGPGSTNVIFSFDANTGATRTGTLTIAGQTLTVTQAGSTYVQAGVLTTLYSTVNPGLGGITVDGQGNVYFESGDSIEEWNRTNNTVSTVIPFSGSFHSHNVAVDSAGNLYVANEGPAEIDKWTATNGVLTTLVPGLTEPIGIAVDGSGNVYFTDVETGVNEWVAASNSVVTLAGGEPFDVAVDAANNVYYDDSAYTTVNERFQNNSVTTLINYNYSVNPVGIAVDGGGNLYIISDYGEGVFKWSPATGSQTTALGVTAPVDFYFLAVDGARNLYFAITYNAGGTVPAVLELPYSFVDPTAKSEPFNAGSDSLPAALPANINLNTPFAPTSDQSWLTITGTANGVVSYSFTINNSAAPRTAHIQLLGQSITINQAGVAVVPPQLTGPQLLGNGAFQFTFTNTPGTTFTVLATTNLTLPLANWVNLGTVSNVSPGIYQFTSPLTNSQEFYEVIWP